MNKQQPTDSLSIIEDCLERIYQARRASLLSKARKFKEKQARKAFEYVPTAKKVAAPVAESDLSGYAEKDILEELDVKYRAPPAVAVPYVKEHSRVAQQYEEQDAKALELFRTFCNDLKEIIEDFPTRLPEDEFRATYCDDFIGKYLTEQFDRMMPTRTLAKIKKHTTIIIEEFASKDDSTNIYNLISHAMVDCAGVGVAPTKSALKQAPQQGSAVAPTTTALPVAVAKSSDTGAKRSTVGNPAVETADISESLVKVVVKTGAPAVAAQPPTAAAMPSVGERQKSDKQRIKAQYEQLMTMKKKAENHPDEDAINQYSALHADIQSVIDSIQKGKPMK
jgi:hypothetical protein